MTLVPSFLIDAQGDRRLAVHVGVCGRVLEGAGDRRHVAEGDDGVAVGLERQRVDVLRGGDEAGHFDVERALAGVERAAGHHHVVLGQRIEQLRRR